MKWDKRLKAEHGTTIIELLIALAVLGAVTVSMFALYTSLMNSMYVARNRSIATTLATNQMEYLKGLPYDSLAVAGGSIYATNPLPATSTQQLNGVTFTVTTSINYVDDAYDACANYPTQAIKELYCRNYPPPTGSPAVDTNPQDYKIIHVSVQGRNGDVLAEVDTQIAARVAETSSTTGALLVTVLDETGNPVSGASVSVTNSTIAPAVNLSDTTDSNGVAIFYGLPPDTNNDYVVSASKANYSSLSTIAAAGSLQPTYPNLNIVTQQSSSVTLVIIPKASNSLIIEAVDTAGTPISGLQVYVKGGYKRYIDIADTSYYFDNLTPDTRPTTDASGIATISNLTPGDYYFCGDAGATGCVVGASTRYLVAAMPYTTANSFYPVSVPRYESASPPAVLFAQGGNNYVQKVRLVFSTNSNHPRIQTLNPSAITASSTTLNPFTFDITGQNLPCSAIASSCSTEVSFTQGATVYTAQCTGTTGLSINCSTDFTGVANGFLPITLEANGYTFTAPASPPMGGINVSP